MENYRLDWNLVDWLRLQNMTIHIAENEFAHYRFEEYLKQGHKQDGIDVIGYKANDREIVIQCKKVKEINQASLPVIVNKFLQGEYGKRASTFILCTSADLQKPDLQRELLKQKDRLKRKNVYFDYWDIHGLENKLKRHWDVVADYFGKDQADKFCFSKLHISGLENLNPVKDYIPRKVILINGGETSRNNIMVFGSREMVDLGGLFLNTPEVIRRICLVGEAHYGKSSCLRQTAFLLKNAGNRLQPLFIEIKEWNIQPIENILNTEFGSWKNIPLQDLVIFIDGLDESPTDKFEEIVHYISEFSKAFPSISMVVSCRQVFHKKYNVEGVLGGFKTYLLGPLSQGEALRYIHDMTGPLFDQFQETVNKLKLGALLLHPFFLVYIIQRFTKSGHQMPTGKIQIIDDFISESFQNSETRRLGKSQKVEYNTVQFDEVVRQFALAMQIAGTNVISDTDLQRLFTPEQRSLFEHNSLISISNRNWSFTNAIFQEHLAASRLTNCSFQKIAELSSVGTHFRKIRTKWIQTLSSLLAMLDSNSSLYTELLQFIEADNFELIFLTESKNYPPEFKLNVFEQLMRQYENQHTVPVLIDEQTISYFIEDVDEALALCMDYIEGPANERTKAICCRILRASKMSQEYLNRFSAFVLQEISRTDDSFYAGLLVEVLAMHKMGDRQVVESLIGMEKHVRQHDFRDKLYYLLTALNLSDHFYLFGIDGIGYLIAYNQTISHFGSEFNLQNFLLSTEKINHFSYLFKAMQTDGWLNFYRFKNDYGVSFMSRLTDKCIEYFKKDSRIFILVANFIRELGRNYLRDDFKEIDRFILVTNSNKLLIRMFWREIFEDNNWEFATFITPDCFDFLIHEFEEGGYPTEVLKRCINSLKYRKQDQIADEFYALCVDVTGGAILDDLSEYTDYQNADLRKRENDLIYVQSVEAFRNGVKNYFNAFGKKVISENDLYIDFSINHEHRQVDSYFVYYFLLNFGRSNRKIYLKDCLQYLVNEEQFEFFRSGQILNYNYRTEASDKILLPIIENYYLSGLKLASFGNKITNREIRLGEIYMKYRFKTEKYFLLDMVWLDTGGLRDTRDLNRSSSISHMIMKDLNDENLGDLRLRILANMTHGIISDGVLGNHISLCRFLKIKESANLLFTLLESRNSRSLYAPDVVDIYVELGGSKKQLLALFKTINDFEEDLFLPLAKHLIPNYRGDAATKLLIALGTPINESQKVSIARLLAIMEKIEGFKFLVETMEKTKKAPYHVQAGYQVFNVNTELALVEIDKIGYMLVDLSYSNYQDFGESARSILIEWLKGFASKSERDLILVIEFIYMQQEKLKLIYDNTTDLNWVVISILNDFRDSNNEVKSISEVKAIMDSLI